MYSYLIELDMFGFAIYQPPTPFALFATLITANKGAFKWYLSNSIQFNVITSCILI